jgi:DNA-binding MarR family transcriptional regulator
MSKTISATALRDRLLARLQAPVASEDWVRVLAVPGHRELLGIIARHEPPSVGALSELAGRAQPNVSRALSALMAAGLIEVVTDGRRSIPRVTEMGAAKVRELGLLDVSDESPVRTVAGDLFAIETPSALGQDDDGGPSLEGCLTTWLWLSSSRERVAARTSGNLDALGTRLLTNWWRILYRRDAPYRLWEFTVEDGDGSLFALAATASGANIKLHARNAIGRMLDLGHGSRVVSVAALEQHLLTELLHPLAARHWLSGRSALPLHGLLRRIEDSRAQVAESAFCRTAGALGLSPYDLADDGAEQVRELLDLIVDEDARLDFSSAVLADSLADGHAWVSKQLDERRHRNAMPALAELRKTCTLKANAAVRPFRHGYDLARTVREYLKLAEDQSVGGVAGLSKMLGASDGVSLSPDAPGSLRAFQSFDADAPTFIVEDEGERSSVFTLARGVGDFIAFGSRASCVADLYTDRQAVGRAFAAEFMAPRTAVVRMVEEEDQSLSNIADHFGVSPSVVHRQYENAAA